jgi:hypothetical protein
VLGVRAVWQLGAAVVALAAGALLPRPHRNECPAV